MKTRAVTKYAATTAIILLLAGCASDAGEPGPPTTSDRAPSSTSETAAPATITIADFGFDGPTTVPAGTTVEVVNMDSVAHTVTADDGTSFDITIEAGGKGSFTAPAKTGTYDYHCSLHPSMHGSLDVNQ